MIIYDGVLCKVINTNEKGDLELEVLEMMPWENAPDIGSRFWVPGDDEHLGQKE